METRGLRRHARKSLVPSAGLRPGRPRNGWSQGDGAEVLALRDSLDRWLDSEGNRGAVPMSEHQYGRFVQTVPLPDDIDGERGEARMGRGVLTISFPKLGVVRKAGGSRAAPSARRSDLRSAHVRHDFGGGCG